MSKANDILKEAIALPPDERVALISELMNSLDERDSAIDALWAAEAEERINAYDKGVLKSVTLDKVLRKYR